MDSRSQQDIIRLLAVARNPGAFFILGAGVSARLLPMVSGLEARIPTAYREIGRFPIDCLPPSPIRSRLLASSAKAKLGLETLLLRYAPEHVLLTLVQRELTLDDAQPAPPEYAVFRMLPGPHTIFNFNVDGLAIRYLGDRHSIFEPHGRIDEYWTRHPELDLFLFDGCELPSLSPKHLWGPEPADITRREPYRKAWPLLRTASSVVIVGYSFGECNGRMDDGESFEWLLAGIEGRHCPVVLVNPHPEPLAAAIEDRRGHPVLPIKERWDELSTCMLRLIAGRARRN